MNVSSAYSVYKCKKQCISRQRSATNVAVLFRRQIFQARHDEIYATRGVITQLRLYPHYRGTGVTRGSGNRLEIYKRLRGS